MITLTDAERDDAMRILESCGLEGEDARTGLDLVCRVAEASTLAELVESLAPLNDLTLQGRAEALAERFGTDARRHVSAFMRKLLP